MLDVESVRCMGFDDGNDKELIDDDSDEACELGCEAGLGDIFMYSILQ